jgi:hypothetical protein
MRGHGGGAESDDVPIPRCEHLEHVVASALVREHDILRIDPEFLLEVRGKEEEAEVG